MFLVDGRSLESESTDSKQTVIEVALDDQNRALYDAVILDPVYMRSVPTFPSNVCACAFSCARVKDGNNFRVQVRRRRRRVRDLAAF